MAQAYEIVEYTSRQIKFTNLKMSRIQSYWT